MSQNITGTNAASPTAIALQHLGHGLINQESKQNILELTAKLPRVDQGFFECHFSREGQVDFAMPVPIDKREAIEAIMDLQRGANAAKMLEKNGSPVTEKNIENLWFEFDTSSTNFNGLPGVFFDTHRLHYQNLNSDVPDNMLWSKSLKNMIPAIGCKNGTAENLAAIQHCIDLLSGFGYPAYIGIMKNREDDLRLCVKILDTAQLLPYLKSAGVELKPGVREKLAELAGICDMVAVDFDFENGKISPHFGIELHISKDKDLALYEENLVSYLVQYGLCNAEQAEYVLNWPQAEANEFIHKISHFKLKLEHGNIVAAKSYLQYIYKEN